MQMDPDLTPATKSMKWPVLTFLTFTTIVGFEDVIYPFQNQGLSVVFSWLFMAIAYVLPYGMISAQMGSTFNEAGGGLASWSRRALGDGAGYWTGWMFWASLMPYTVDVANSVIVSLSWTVLGDNTLDKYMNNVLFGVFTFVVIGAFLLFQNFVQRSLEIMGMIAGAAMFIMTVLFVIMTVVGLRQGIHIATQPFDLKAFIPHFDTHYFATTGLLVFAVSGAELGAAYVTRLRDPKSEFPKAMYLLIVLTAFLTIFGSIALGVFFNAHHLPDDLKMNGAFYAFERLGESLGMGKWMLHIYSFVSLIYMLSQLAVLLDASSRVLSADQSDRYMPSWMRKMDRSGRPIHSYTLTAGLCLFLLLMSGTLPSINSIFNWLLNLNGIVTPYKSCWLFLGFIALRLHQEDYNSPFVFIKNRRLALAVGVWGFAFAFVCASLGVLPQEGAVWSGLWWHELFLNIVSVAVLFGVGGIMPLLAHRERQAKGNA
ncbi:MAG: APC family permease [Lactobacillus sp.]|nr:APC family permease [Lactobacillus sp.]MCI2033071.1 APC family permease [Lactobacillus sp.]